MYKITSEELEAKHQDEIGHISLGEWESWANHPCAKALQLKLMADEAGLFEDWMNDSLDPDQAKWLIRYIETILDSVFRSGLYSEDERYD